MKNTGILLNFEWLAQIILGGGVSIWLPSLEVKARWRNLLSRLFFSSFLLGSWPPHNAVSWPAPPDGKFYWCGHHSWRLTDAYILPGLCRGRHHAWSFGIQAPYLEAAGERCAVLLNSKSCPTGGSHVLRYHSIPVIKVISLFPSALYFHFISQLVKNLGTGDIYWKLSNSHT